MPKLGVKSKINLGFGALALLLLLSGAISVYEFARMRATMSGVLSSNVNNLALSRQVLEVVRHLNYSMEELVVANEASARRQLFLADSMNAVLRERAKVVLGNIQKTEMVNSVGILLKTLRDDVENAFALSPGERHALYFGRYSTEQRMLLRQLDDIMELIQQALQHNAEQVEQHRYRIIMPGIISVSAGLVLILLFNYFIVYFFVNPLVKITRAVENTVEYGSPFKLNVESNDELGELKEAVSQLAQQAKKAARADAESPSFNRKA